MVDPARPPCIYVLAGVNGAGKSSVAGAALRAVGQVHFDPDDVARRMRAANPGLGIDESSAAAWQEGRRLLERATAERRTLAFETTLGGNTIPALLDRALDAGLEVRMWYAGLASPELHISRVRARVARGGHDIPAEKIRERYDSSRRSLIRLLPKLTLLRVYDNSEDADPAIGESPKPVLVLHTERGKIRVACEPAATPDWAKPIVMAALKLRKPPPRRRSP